MCLVERIEEGMIVALTNLFEVVRLPKSTFYGRAKRRMPKIKQLLLIYRRIVPPLIQMVSHSTKRGQEPWLGSISSIS